uniref:Ferritin n=1 Tax=Hucho hucho TaxID=62062 RepID=A0A4W5LF53_9TELE
MESQIRQNYHNDCEAAINRMINMEMFASYTYTSMLSCHNKNRMLSHVWHGFF